METLSCPFCGAEFLRTRSRNENGKAVITFTQHCECEKDSGEYLCDKCSDRTNHVHLCRHGISEKMCSYCRERIDTFHCAVCSTNFTGSPEECPVCNELTPTVDGAYLFPERQLGRRLAVFQGIINSVIKNNRTVKMAVPGGWIKVSPVTSE